MSFVTAQEKVKVLLSLVYKKKKKIGRLTRKRTHLKCSWRGPPASREDWRWSNAQALLPDADVNSCRHVTSLLISLRRVTAFITSVHVHKRISYDDALTNSLFIWRAYVLLITQDNYLRAMCIFFNVFIILLNILYKTISPHHFLDYTFYLLFIILWFGKNLENSIK